MKHATDVRGSALIAGEVTMLRSQADVKFDTGDKEVLTFFRSCLFQLFRYTHDVDCFTLSRVTASGLK